MLYLVFILTPQVFLGYRIYMSFFQTVPPQLVLALGLTLVITAGEIDLSFPAVVALSGFLFAWSFKHGLPPWFGFLAGLAGGGLVGYINGCWWRASGFLPSWPPLPRSSSGTASRSCWRAACSWTLPR